MSDTGDGPKPTGEAHKRKRRTRPGPPFSKMEDGLINTLLESAWVRIANDLTDRSPEEIRTRYHQMILEGVFEGAFLEYRPDLECSSSTPGSFEGLYDRGLVQESGSSATKSLEGLHNLGSVQEFRSSTAESSEDLHESSASTTSIEPFGQGQGQGQGKRATVQGQGQRATERRQTRRKM